MSSTVDVLVDRLRDRRSRKVAFVSHCLLNENTRYLGGACRGCCVREVVDDLLDRDIGIVQMPCPEQLAWGGVLKRHMLRLYGHRRAGALGGIVRASSRFLFRRLARRIAAQIADYLDSGCTIEAVIGVDGSPTCGVARTIDIRGALHEMAITDPETVTVDDQNALVRRHLAAGGGLFIEELQRELQRRHVSVPFRAHDLITELDGQLSAACSAPTSPAARAGCANVSARGHQGNTAR